MLKQLLKRLREPADDRMQKRKARREQRAADARYDAGMEAAKSPRDREEVEHHYFDELDVIWDPIRIKQTRKLTTDARSYGVPVPPKPKLNEDDKNWSFSNYEGDWYLTPDAERRLKREVRKERWQGNDEWRKKVTLVLSIAAFVLALVSLLMKQKQPDPCPKNYYRSDSGECVFALQKPHPTQPQPSATTPSKPSAGKP